MADASARSNVVTAIVLATFVFLVIGVAIAAIQWYEYSRPSTGFTPLASPEVPKPTLSGAGGTEEGAAPEPGPAGGGGVEPLPEKGAAEPSPGAAPTF